MARGFTLIELIVVLLLAAILAAGLIPRAPSSESLTILGRADQLASDIRYAQMLAMTTTTNPALTARRGYCIRLTTSTYAIQEGYDAVTPANNCITAVAHPAALQQPLQLCSGCMTLTNLPNNYVQFDGLGIPYSAAATALAANATIQLIDGGITKTITISAVTGRVVVQ